MTYFVVAIVALLAFLALLLLGKLQVTQKVLESEREERARERERLTFDLELARALARSGRVYVVESADALVDAEYWRPHTFFLDPDEAETYAESISHLGGRQIPGALMRVREMTPADLPPMRTRCSHGPLKTTQPTTRQVSVPSTLRSGRRAGRHLTSRAAAVLPRNLGVVELYGAR